MIGLLIVAWLAVAAAGIMAGSLALVRRTGGRAEKAAFVVLLGIGLIFGIVASFDEWQYTPTRRVMGWPIPVAMFVLEGDRWTDFVVPAPIGYGLVAVNTALVSGFTQLPLLATLWIRSRRRPMSG